MEKNHWVDQAMRDKGTYRKNAVSSLGEVTHTDEALLQLCNSNDMEEAMVAALDAGLTAEEITDILLGATS